MKKPIIFCIIGESGSGKSAVAKHVRSKYGIEVIKSYTERRKRESEIEAEKRGEPLDHVFISKKEFDAIPGEDMIAHTNFGDYRYCCTKQDVKDINIYLIDEFGVDLLKKDYGDVYDIVTIRIKTSEAARIARGVSTHRLARDVGKFTKPSSYFDHCISNDASLDILKATIGSIIELYTLKQ